MKNSDQKLKIKEIKSDKILKENHYTPEDLEYMKSLSSAVLEKSTLSSRLILWIVGLSIIWLIVWANNAYIDEITRGVGKVIPTHKIQIVQSLEGGIVSEVYVQEGDEVKENQPLLKLQDVIFSSSYKENKVRIDALKAKILRLTAEAGGKPFVFREKDIKDKKLKKLILDEKSLYESDMKQLQSSLDVVSAQLKQKKNELLEAKAKKKQMKKSLELIDEEINIKKPLVKRGIVPNTELIALKREKNSIAGDLEAVTLSIPRIESSIKETKKRYQEIKITFQNKAKKELNDVKAELSGIEESIKALGDRVYRTLIKAPVAGVIKQLFVNTKGGVVSPGQDIVEIVPKEDTLVIEAKIKPSDIAFLHLGQKATIKFTAYDFAIYGGLKGVVTHISADTITDKEDNTFYLVHVKAEKNYLKYRNEKLYIKVGMVATVDILTGKKTILDYILKPILKAKQNALRER